MTAEGSGRLSPRAGAGAGAGGHWEQVYRTQSAQTLSWHQAEPAVSLDLIEALDVGHGEAVVDIGGGTSLLAARLLDRGFTDVTVLDLSASALASAKASLGELAEQVCWLEQDVLDWSAARRFGLWHDRAVFHFLVDASERQRYLASLQKALAPGGAVVLGTFAVDGPARCSGLPVARYGPTELAATLGARFTLVQTRREEHRTPSGAIQPFTWIAVARQSGA